MINIKPQGAFTEMLWQSIEDIFQKISSCDFIAQLTDGTLGEKSFAHYLAQDVIYLEQDNAALKKLSDRIECKAQADFFLSLANCGIELEQIMHNEYLSYFGVIEAKHQSPVFLDYGAFFTRHAWQSSCPVAAAALLPCFWIYAETGVGIVEKSAPNNRYEKFISTYSGEEFNVYIEQYLKIMEELGRGADSETKQKMKDVFIEGSQYELDIFEEATEIAKTTF